jgi:3-oxoacyl-(acyl-carrier-protein) synthase
MQKYKSMESPVFVAGLGVISAIGNNINECLSAFENEQAGMGDISYLETIHRKKIPVAALWCFTND